MCDDSAWSPRRSDGSPVAMIFLPAVEFPPDLGLPKTWVSSSAKAGFRMILRLILHRGIICMSYFTNSGPDVGPQDILQVPT